MEAPDPSAAASSDERSGVGTGPFAAATVRAAYDSAASDYAEAFGDELAQLPLDREMLDAAFDAAPLDRWVLEIGCGPAPAAAYLAGRAGRAGRAWHVLGIDLSAAMLAVAGTRNPSLRRAQADLRDLPLRDGCCALVIAFYVVQHLPRPDLPAALAELCRVLTDDGVLLVAAHLGDRDVVSDEFLGHRIEPVGGALYTHDELESAIREAGFDVEVERQRGPMPNEFDSQRLYLIARRRAQSLPGRD